MIVIRFASIIGFGWVVACSDSGTSGGDSNAVGGNASGGGPASGVGNVSGSAAGQGPTTIGGQPSTGGTTGAAHGGVTTAGAGAISVVEIAAADAGFKTPTDLAFHSWIDDELWVTSADDDAVVLIHRASEPKPTFEKRRDGYAQHFMDNPFALAFGAEETTTQDELKGTFSTCQESTNTYNDPNLHHGNFFMGATLWPANIEAFGIKNEHPELFEPDGSCHLDMVHTAPNCGGIAHEANNRYWVFSGTLLDEEDSPTAEGTWRSGIVQIDFGRDHGYGRDDHADGRSKQYVAGKLKRVAGIPSHIAFDSTSSHLYIADTGNARIVRLDTKSGKPGELLYNPDDPSNKQGSYQRIDDAELTEVVPASTRLLMQPAGLELRGAQLYVSDHQSGKILVFGLDGTLQASVDVTQLLGAGSGPVALAGMAFSARGELFVADMKGNRVLKLRGLN